MLLSVGFVAMALASWRAWGDPVADFPKQIYMAWRIGAGEILYRDIRHYYGPLSQLFNGGVFALFGTSYLTLVAANLVIAWGVAMLLYFAIARCADRITASIAAATFILVHAFQHLGQNASYNFIAPYSHEATHGVALLLVVLIVAAGASVASSTRRWLALGAMLGALMLTKPELILASFAAVGGVLVLQWPGMVRQPAAFLRVVIGLSFGAGIVVLTAMAYFLLGAGASFAQAISWTFGAVTPLWSASAFGNPIYGEVSGLSVLQETLPTIAATSITILGALAAAVCIDLLPVSAVRRWLGIVYVSSLVPLLYLSSGIVPPYNYSYALPFLSTLGVLLLVTIHLRSGLHSTGQKLAFLTGIAAVAMSLKIYFNATFWWMGFSLLVPATIFLVLLGVYVLPMALRAIRPEAFVVRWTTAALVAAMSVHVAHGSVWTYGTKELALGDGADRFYAFGYSPEATLIHGAIDRLRVATEPESTLMLFPGGVLANYVLRRPNPTPFVANLGSRTWYEASGGTPAIVKSMEQAPPDYVVYLRTPPLFPGPVYEIWGPQGYANELIEWIAAHYEEVERVGPLSQNFGELIYVLLKKRENALAPSREPPARRLD